MNKDISILVPSIRPKNLIKFFSFAQKACQRYSFELVIPSPYLIPDEILSLPNVKFIHTHANPTLAFQMAARLCDSEFLYNTTDDGLIQENAIDNALDFFKSKLTDNDLINMRYIEGNLDVDSLEPLNEYFNPHSKSFEKDYWFPYYHEPLRLRGISPDWKLCPHFLIKSKFFTELGGFDCEYEYSNHALHDLAFRAQCNGSKVFDSPTIAFHCSHTHGPQSDHKPVEDAQEGPDLERFNSIYGKENAAQDRVFLNYDDCKKKDRVWKRRFPTSPLPIRL